MREEAKETLRATHDIVNNLEDFISSLQIAFIYNNVAPLTDVKERIDNLKKLILSVTEKIVTIARDDHSMRRYVTIPTNLLRITENIKKISELISTKIKEDLLFSDRAISEIILIAPEDYRYLKTYF